MKCYRCPFIQEEFDKRIQMWDGRGRNGLIDYDEAESEHVDYCYCEKVGHKLYAGRCSDAECVTEEEWNQYREEHGLLPILRYIIDDSEENQKQIDILPKETKMQRKRRRMAEYRDHLRELSKYHRICSGAYPADRNKNYDDENPVRYIRCYNPRRAKWIKKYCNKKVRRTKGVASRKGYRKVSDYDWMLW